MKNIWINTINYNNKNMKNKTIKSYLEKNINTFIYEDFYDFDNSNFCDYRSERKQKISSFFQKIYLIGCLYKEYNYIELLIDYKNCNKLIDYKVLNEYNHCKEVLNKFDDELKTHLEKNKINEIINNQSINNKQRKTNKI